MPTLVDYAKYANVIIVQNPFESSPDPIISMTLKNKTYMWHMIKNIVVLCIILYIIYRILSSLEIVPDEQISFPNIIPIAFNAL